MPRGRSYSPPSSYRYFRDDSPPPLRRVRSIGQNSYTQKYGHFETEAGYRKAAKGEWPPDGFKRYKHTGGRNRDWPADCVADYNHYSSYNSDWKKANKAYTDLRDARHDYEKVSRYKPSFPEVTSTYQPFGTGVYSYTSHRALRDAAYDRESAAYLHAKYRSKFMSDYPLVSSTRHDHNMHVDKHDLAWRDYGKSLADLEEHDYYGARRRRYSFSTPGEFGRDREKKWQRWESDWRRKRY